MLAKPQMWWPGINWQHPYAQNLVGAWLLQEGAGSQISDLVHPEDEAVISTPWIGSAVGGGVSYLDNVANITTLAARDRGFNDTNECTVVVRSRVASGNQDGICEFSNGSLNTGFLMFNNSSAARWRCLAGGRSSGTSVIFFSTSIPYEAVLVGTYSTTAGQFLYADGELGASDNTFTGDFNNTIDGTGRLGGLIGLWPLSGNVQYVLVYNRAWGASDVARISADPLAPFRIPSIARRHVVSPVGLSIPIAMHHYKQLMGAN